MKKMMIFGLLAGLFAISVANTHTIKFANNISHSTMYVNADYDDIDGKSHKVNKVISYKHPVAIAIPDGIKLHISEIKVKAWKIWGITIMWFHKRHYGFLLPTVSELEARATAWNFKIITSTYY